MQMPEGVPSALLQHYSLAKNDLELASMFQHPSELAIFFQYACDDETWVTSHQTFIMSALKALTEAFDQGKLELTLAEAIAKGVQYHFYMLKADIPLDLVCELSSHDVAINSLMFQAVSPFFRRLISDNVEVRRSRRLALKAISYEHFIALQEYIYTGFIKDRWNYSAEKLVAMLSIANMVELPQLASQCEHTLVNYIIDSNAMHYLELSHRRGWQEVKIACCEHINRQIVGLTLTCEVSNQLTCTVYTLNERDLTVFDELKGMLTEVICHGDTLEDERLAILIGQASQLRTLDIGQTRAFTPHLSHVPAALWELSLAGCQWLNNKNFRDIINVCPQIQKLTLTSCTSLTSLAWGNLLQLNRLHSLGLEKCVQVDDEALKLILQAARQLHTIDLAGNLSLTYQGFHLLTNYRQPLSALSLSRTALSDQSLLELLLALRELETLELVRCQQLTEQGILAAVTQTPSLRYLDLSGCAIPAVTVDELRRRMPFVKIVFEA